MEIIKSSLKIDRETHLKTMAIFLVHVLLIFTLIKTIIGNENPLPNGLKDFMESNKKKGLMYSPYDFSPGGGEKYFLEALSNFIDQGYNMAIVTHATNFCKNKECIKSTAEKLRVVIRGDFEYFPLEYVHLKDSHIKGKYDVYYAMGNGRFPEFPSPSSIGLYQCQFPFDLDRAFSDQEVEYYKSYHSVIVNSQFTKKHYIQYTMPAYQKLIAVSGHFPSVSVVYPPVERMPFDGTARIQRLNEKPDFRDIIMLGRIFKGRQSKGHVQAIRGFKQLVDSKPAHQYRLNIVGNVHPGFEDFSKELQVMAQGYPIEFHFGISSEKLKSMLLNANLLWHLTGIDEKDDSDPASFEHFGISICEGISAGLTPIVFAKGGTREVIGPYGRAVSTVEQLVQATLDFSGELLTEARYREMYDYAARFGIDVFRSKFNSISRYITGSNYFVEKQLPLLPYTCPSLNFSSPHSPKQGLLGTAWIYLDTPISHLKMVTNNVVGMLGHNWKLQIAHPPYMVRFLQAMYAHEPHTDLQELVLDVSQTDAYSKWQTTSEFWEQISTDFVLIFHPDSVLLRPNVDQYLEKAPFLSAPFCVREYQGLRNMSFSTRLGDGDVALRSKFKALECVKNSKVQSQYAQYLEDLRSSTSSDVSGLTKPALPVMKPDSVFFSACLKQLYSKEEVASFEKMASQFSISNICTKKMAQRKKPPLVAESFWLSSGSPQVLDKYIVKSRDYMTKIGSSLFSCQN